MSSKQGSPPKRVTFNLPNGNSDDRAGCSTSVKKTEAVLPEHSNSHRPGSDKFNVLKKNSSVKKVFVRHAETDLPTEKVVCKIPEDIQLTEIIESSSDVAHTYKPRYAAPEFFSALSIAKEFQDKKEELQNEKCLPVPVPVKQIVDGKVASKLNFSPEEQLFKDLVNLNVNDEMLIDVVGERPAIRKLPKDEEPKLSDFFQPKFLGEYTSVSEPTLPVFGKIRHYDGFSTYKRKIAWTSAENP